MNAHVTTCMLQVASKASKGAREEEEAGSNADTDAQVVVISNAASVRRHVKIGSSSGS